MARIGRPPKEKTLLMNAPLRIMLTADQKDLIDQAARMERMETAEWARPLLLQAAQEVVDKNARRPRQK